MSPAEVNHITRCVLLCVLGPNSGSKGLSPEPPGLPLFRAQTNVQFTFIPESDQESQLLQIIFKNVNK